MKEKKKLDEIVHHAIEVAIRLGILLGLVAWCFQILQPFSGVLLWGMILALAVNPMFESLSMRLGNRPKWAATILGLCGLTIIILPSWLFIDSMIGGVLQLKASLETGAVSIPPPTEQVAGWPLIGPQAFEIWTLASQNLGAFISKYQGQITEIAGSLVERVMSAGGSVLQFFLAMIIAGILLVTEGKGQFVHKFFSRLVGAQANEFMIVTQKTVQSVTKGVLGVAFIQATLVGLGLLFAGVPHAGLWTLIVLILALLQLPAGIVVIPVIFYLFSVDNPLLAAIWSVYLLLAGLSDNVLKPVLLGRSAPVPMVVIFLGVIGGFMLSGFIGLFTGAIILSLGYKLFLSWLEDGNGKGMPKRQTSKSS